MKNFFTFVLCLGLIGCAASRSIVIKPFVDPQYGMTKSQMIDLLGTPQSIEIYKKTNLTRVEFYIYVRRYQSFHDNVPVCLINNKIVGWGKSYYADHVSPDDIRIK